MAKKSKTDVDALRPLPTSVEQLDSFVSDVTKQFNLPEGDDTYESIATMIMHMPQSAFHAPLRYFGESVLKSLANKAAYEKMQEFAQKRRQKQEETQKNQASNGSPKEE